MNYEEIKSLKEEILKIMKNYEYFETYYSETGWSNIDDDICEYLDIEVDEGEELSEKQLKELEQFYKKIWLDEEGVEEEESFFDDW